MRTGIRTGRTVALVATALLLAGALLGCRGAAPPPSRTASPAADADSPLSVLRAWDQRRAAAYASGDPAALRALYRPGSGAGDRDVRLLRRYAARGLRVTGLQTQVLAAAVRTHDRDRLVLAVTERLAGGLAIGARTRVRLPHGSPRERVVVLVRGDDGWMVAAVREPEPAGRRR